MGLISSADTIGGWKNHFKRMERWKERVLDALDDHDGRDIQEVFDFTLAYFLWCHSFREWLINSGTIDKELLNAELSNSTEWKICRDIANRTRHFDLRNNPRDKDWTLAREYDLWAKVEQRPLRHVPFIVSGDQKLDVKELISSTFNMWKGIVDRHCH